MSDFINDELNDINKQQKSLDTSKIRNLQTSLRSGGGDSIMFKDAKTHFQRSSIATLIKSVSNQVYLKSNQSVLEERKSRGGPNLSIADSDDMEIKVEVVQPPDMTHVLGKSNRVIPLSQEVDSEIR